MRRKVAVIGAGIGGLASAALLSAAGHQVTLFEQNNWLGGKCRRLVHNGVVIDTGPAMFTFPGLWAAFIKRWQDLAGCTVKAPVLVRLPSVGRYLREGFAQDIPFDRNDPNYASWQEYADRNAGLGPLLEHLLQVDPRSSAAVVPALRMLWQLGGSFDMASWLQRKKRLDAKLKDIIALQSLNAGGSPQQVPALFASLLATLSTDGVYAPEGGMYQIINFLRELLECKNVEVKLDFRVTQLQDQIVCGGAGYSERFDLIVSDVDPSLTAQLSQAKSTRVASSWLSCSVVGLFGAVAPGVSADLPFLQVAMPSDNRRFFAQLESQGLPESTMVFVHNYPRGHRTNPDKNHATMAMLFTVPAKAFAKVDLDEFLSRQSERVAHLLGLKEAASPKAPLQSLWQGVPLQLGPEYYGEFGHPSGALYGLIQNPRKTGPFHPVPYQDPRGWLWQVGAGVHPGGGIPGTIGGAMIAVNKILQSLSVSKHHE